MQFQPQRDRQQQQWVVRCVRGPVVNRGLAATLAPPDATRARVNPVRWLWQWTVTAARRSSRSLALNSSRSPSSSSRSWVRLGLPSQQQQQEEEGVIRCVVGRCATGSCHTAHIFVLSVVMRGSAQLGTAVRQR
jgi:hypothetical protein